MSRSNRDAKSSRFVVTPYQFPNSRKLWHNKNTSTPLLGCDACYYRETCGGLQIGAQAFDCMSFCACVDPSECDNVCPRNAEHLVARVREVGGWLFDDVSHVACPEELVLPSLIPLVYHKSGRTRAPNASAIALSLYELLDKRTGELRYGARGDLCNHFKLASDAMIVLSGSDTDPALERWWRVADRRARAQELAELGIKLVTSPNFSLFDDVPRLDNLYNMKRIAVASAELQSAGIHCAVHLNARTDKDWEHWTRHLASHSEYTYVSFEFATGAGSPHRIPWHIEHLLNLARDIARPLNLVVRGGTTSLPELANNFASVTLIDTGAFVRAQKRRRACIVNSKLRWKESPTGKGESIDDLFDDNVLTMDRHMENVLQDRWRPLVRLPVRPNGAYHAGDKTLEQSGLAKASSDQ